MNEFIKRCKFNLIVSIRRFSLLKVVFIFIVLLTSCEDVIDIDLNSTDPALVIESTILKGGFCKASLSYTSDYFSDETPQIVEDALIRLINTQGEVDTLVHINNGLYIGNLLAGKENQEYDLLVEVDRVVYHGKSTLPKAPVILNIESIESEYFGSFIGDSVYELSITFVRGDNDSQYFLVNTAIFEDGSITFGDYDFFKYEPSEALEQTFTPQGEFVEVDDTVLVFMYATDEDTYNYYLDLVESDSGGPGSTPYNPYSNIYPQVLGYFGAMSRDIYQLIVEEPILSD